MRTLNTGRGRFYEPVSIVGGPSTRAIIQRADIKDKPQTANPDYPKLTCRVLPTSIIRAGQVLQLQSGDYYLVTNHSATSDYVLYHLFRADRQMTWKRKVMGVDPLTGQPRDSGTMTALGSVWVMSERVRRQFTDTASHFNVENLLVITGAQVLIDDFLDGKIVKRTLPALGVNIVELQG